MSAALGEYDYPDEKEDDQALTRLLTSGPESLSDAECLALLIRSVPVSTCEDAIETARRLIARYGSVQALARREVSELTMISGMSRFKAAQIVAAIELGRRASTPHLARLSLTSSTEVARHYLPKLRCLQREIFAVVLLDARNCLLREVTVSEGSLTASIVHPRECFKPAIIESAASVIFVHNHPSGDPTPSQDDLRITAQLVEAGKILDIRVLDHIVVGHADFVSMAGKGLI